MMLWQGVLVSIVIHAVLLALPVAVCTTREPPLIQELHLVLMDAPGVEEEHPPVTPAASLSHDTSNPPSQDPPPEASPVDPEPLVVEREPEAPAREILAPPKPKPLKKVKKPHVPKQSPRSEAPREDVNRSRESAQNEREEPKAQSLSHAPPAPGHEHHGPVETAFGSRDGPRFVRRTIPRYPRLAREIGKEGTVLLRLSIDERGRLVDVQVLQKAGSGFDEEALRAVRASTFSPASRNGKPVASIAHLPIRFVLKEP